jgi:hypothetical protein
MWNNPGIRFGLLGGFSVVALYTLVYTVDKSSYHHTGLYYGSLIVYAWFMFLASRSDISVNGSARDFRELVRIPFITFLIINLCFWLFDYGLHLYDNSLTAMELQAALSRLKADLEGGVGDPQQANSIRDQIIGIENSLAHPARQPLGPVVTQMFIGALGGFALSAGIVTFVRNRL